MFSYDKVLKKADVKTSLTIYYLQLREDLHSHTEAVVLKRPRIGNEVTHLQANQTLKGPHSLKHRRNQRDKPKGGKVRDAKWRALKHMMR